MGEIGVMRPCFVIPLYNHGGTLPQVVAALLGYGWPVVIVDDGSDAATKHVVTELASIHAQLVVLTLPYNQGKGAAVMAGLRYAHAQGWTHALQLDADAQHDFNDIPHFIAAAASAPTVLWSGAPIYDSSVPAIRFYGRYITHILVWIQTLSLEIRDSMCGFRAYPLNEILPVINQSHIPSRMVFDPEVMVRFSWQGGRIGYIPTKVIYPSSGISHFKVWRDNRQLAWMHCRLVAGMLWRLPKLLCLRNQRLPLSLDWDKDEA